MVERFEVALEDGSECHQGIGLFARPFVLRAKITAGLLECGVPRHLYPPREVSVQGFGDVPDIAEILFQ